jgi:hypothetical protein
MHRLSQLFKETGHCEIINTVFASYGYKLCNWYVEIKCQLDATDEFLLQILLLAQHVPGTFMPIIRSSRVLYK